MNKTLKKILKTKIIVISVLIIGMILPCSAESPLSQKIMTLWSNREGLQSDSVLDVLQDKTGYIWIATYDGLIRFDGTTFTVINKENSSFDSNNARVLHQGNDGRLWIGTNTNGLYAYKDGLFTHYGIEQGLPNLSIRSIVEDPKEGLWVGTANGLARLVGRAFELVQTDSGILNEIITFMVPLNDNSIIIGMNVPGLWLLTDGKIKAYHETLGLAEKSFSCGYLDNKNALWIGTNTGDFLKIEKNKIVESIHLKALESASINTFYRDSDGTLWIGTDKGIVSKNGSTYTFFNEKDGLESNVISSFCKDTEGNLWVGTERGGLVKFSQGKFVHISKSNGLLSDSINAVVEDNYGSLWVATDDGVSFFPSDRDSYHTSQNRFDFITHEIETLKGKRVRQIRLEPDGSLWFSTYSNLGLYVCNESSNSYSITTNEGLPINRVRFSYRTANGDLWVGTTAGPVRFLQTKDTHTLGQAIPLDSSSGIENLFILCASEDTDGKIWLGTDGGGISVYTNNFVSNYSKKDGLAGNVVFRILHDQKKRTWICTAEGLSLFSNNEFKTITAISGLNNQSVFEVLYDANDRLWIITAKKLFVVSADELEKAVKTNKTVPNFTSFDALDGLPGQLSANAWACMNDAGIVHIPTLKGLATYNPQSSYINNVIPPVIIEKIVIDGQEFSGYDYPIKLKPSARRITFHYTALSFVIPQRVSFQYKLEGYDTEWINTEEKREISFTNLHPGTYTFRIKALNNDGIINEQGNSLKFTKNPYLYQTTSFYIFISALVVALVFLIIHLRNKALFIRARRLEILVQERTYELEKEKEKSEQLINNILPLTIAEELKITGKAKPTVYNDVAILFADIVNFTSWASNLDPEYIINSLNEIFTGFDYIMEKNNCERIKTLGDGYLAVSGINNQEKTDSLRLVQAGIDILNFLDHLNKEKQINFEIRIGMCCGSIVGGVVGVKKYIFDIFGDAVNTTFRLETSAVPMGFTISEAIAKQIKDEFVLIPRPCRIYKGKGEQNTYYVKWIKNSINELGYIEIPIIKQRISEYLENKDEVLCQKYINSIDFSIFEPEFYKDLCNEIAEVYAQFGKIEASEKYRDRATMIC